MQTEENNKSKTINFEKIRNNISFSVPNQTLNEHSTPCQIVDIKNNQKYLFLSNQNPKASQEVICSNTDNWKFLVVFIDPANPSGKKRIWIEDFGKHEHLKKDLLSKFKESIEGLNKNENMKEVSGIIFCQLINCLLFQ